ncbi:MAG: hypothetical protein KC912_18540 [Proteobacteria bacterium]|nr:hypothetical protein [Pseudomonadota bacterium]
MTRLLPVLLLSMAACDPGPTWHGDVAPIVNENCVGCHQADQIGPFPLETYEQAVPWGPAMAIETQARTMPPWGADNSGECGEWRDARWLSDEEIQTISDWVAADMPEGRAPKEPLEIAPAETLPEPDVTVDFGFDYTPLASAEHADDDYRCFLLDPELDTDQFITQFEVEPGDPEMVHHVILWSLEDENAQTQAEDLAGAAGSYTCFGASGVNNSNPLATWAPGSGVVSYPEGTGVKIDANRKLIMQVHYHLLPEESRSDRTKVHLKLEEDVDQEAIVWLLADGRLSVPAGQQEAEFSFQFRLSDLNVPFDVDLWGVLPHMHQRGTSIRMTRTPAGGTQECLVDVPVWDFEWQQQYFYEEPIEIGNDDLMQVTCTFDTLDDTAPVSWGDGTEDEMCLVGVFVTL